MKYLFPLLFLVGLLVQTTLAEEYTFSAAEVERKPYHFGGYLEFRPVLIGIDKNASLYKANLFDKNPPNPMMEYNGRLWLDANIQKGIAGFYVQTSTDYTQSDIVTATNRDESLSGLPFPQAVVVIDGRCGKKDVEMGQRVRVESCGICRPAEGPERSGASPRRIRNSISRLHQELFRTSEDLFLHSGHTACLRGCQ